jgi:hypothetical protein
MTKFLLMALATLAPVLRGTLQNSQATATLEMIRQTVRKEVLGLGSRLLVGFIISSAIVLSLAQLGGSLQRWLGRFENALSFEIFGFCGVSLLGSMALYYLFRDVWIPTKQNIQKSESVPPPATNSESTKTDPVDIHGLALRFVEGFSEAVETGKANQKAKVEAPKSSQSPQFSQSKNIKEQDQITLQTL